MTDTAVAKVVESGLTYREEAALRSHLKANEPPLAPTLAAELYGLYLNGMSCEEIQRANPGLKLGQIVRAFRDGDWYNRRVDYMQALLDGVRPRVQQIHSEGIIFAGHVLAMLNKRLGTKVLKYLQSGDEEDLGEMKNWGLAQYKQMVDILQKLTGQDNSKKLSVSAHVQHQGTVNHQEASPAASPVLGPPTSEDAARILEALAGLGTKIS